MISRTYGYFYVLKTIQVTSGGKSGRGGEIERERERRRAKRGKKEEREKEKGKHRYYASYISTIEKIS